MNARASAASLAILFLIAAAPALAQIRSMPTASPQAKAPADPDLAKITAENAIFRAKRISILSKVAPRIANVIVQIAASMGGKTSLPSITGIESATIAKLQSQIPGITIQQTQLLALVAIQEALQNQLDNMNEMSEMTSMDLQMAMDRRSKFVEALSNIMKEIDATQESIVQNLK
jgi:hypothetical protein